MRSFTPFFLILVSIGLFYSYVSPNYKTVQDLKIQSSQYHLALDKAQELENQRDELLTKYNNFSADNINRLNRILPDKVNTVKLIADIDSIAGRYGITVRSVSVAQASIDNSQAIAGNDGLEKMYNTTTISFKFSASYANLVSYLKDLEKSLQMVDVRLIRFEVPGAEENTGINSYEVSIDTYWLK